MRTTTQVTFPDGVASGATVWLSGALDHRSRRNQHRQRSAERHPARRSYPRWTANCAAGGGLATR